MLGKSLFYTNPMTCKQGGMGGIVIFENAYLA